MADNKSIYTIAVVAKLHHEYERYMKKLVGYDRFQRSKRVYDEWEYIHVRTLDGTRGWRFNGYVVTGCYRNPSYHDDDFHGIIDGLKYCLQQSKSTWF